MNANLDIKCEAGKAVVKLTAVVDVLPQHCVQSRNGHSRQRRREIHDAARKAVAAEAALESSVVEETEGPVSKDTFAVNENVLLTAIQSQSEEDPSKVAVSKYERKPITEEVVDDEVCPNEVYDKAKATQSITSRNSAPQSTSTRNPAFAYYSLTYDSE